MISNQSLLNYPCMFSQIHVADNVILFLRALQPPNWLAQWHCGVRVDSNKKLVGFIAALPADVRIYETWVAHEYMQRNVKYEQY